MEANVMEYLTPEDYVIAEANGICQKTAETRFYWRGWPKKRSITEPVHDHVFTKKYRDKCADIGLSYSAF